MDELLFDELTHTYTRNGVVLPSVTELCAPLTAGKYPDSGVVAYAAARGTAVHELCALYDLDELPDEFDAELLPYLQAWATFCRDYRPRWERIEWAGDCLSAAVPFAGKCDRIGVIDGRRGVVDIKTAASMDRAAKVSLCCQLRGYTLIAWEHGLHINTEGLGVQLKKDGTYTVHEQNKIEARYGFTASALFDSLLLVRKALKGEK